MKNAAALASACVLAVLFAAHAAFAQTAATDTGSTPTSAPARDAVVLEPAGKGDKPTHEKLSGIFLFQASAEKSMRIKEAGVTYDAGVDPELSIPIGLNFRLGPTSLGWFTRFALPQSIRTLDGVNVADEITLSSIHTGLMFRLELGSKVRVRPGFGASIGEESLEVGSTKFKGYAADFRATLDVAFPIGSHALVLQAGASLPQRLAAFVNEDKNQITEPIDLQRAPTAFLAIGPEIRR
jgi:hypothetical protein